MIDQLESEAGKAFLPAVHVGDTVEVHYQIREGEKERIQLFTGTVISLSGRSIRRTMTIRRLVQGEGVERTFPIHSPRVKDVTIVRRGEARQSKLYYLRDRVGKQTRVKEFVGEKARRARNEERARREAHEAAGATPAAPSGAKAAEGETPETVEV